MTIALSAAALLFLATVVCIWFFGLRMTHAAIAFLAGFAAAGTAAAPALHALLTAFAHH